MVQMWTMRVSLCESEWVQAERNYENLNQRLHQDDGLENSCSSWNAEVSHATHTCERSDTHTRPEATCTGVRQGPPNSTETASSAKF